MLIIFYLYFLGEYMTAVITKMATTSSLGENFDAIHKKILNFDSGISKIDYFDTEPFMADLAGNLSHEIWDKVRNIATTEKIDNSSALTIYTINKLVEYSDYNPKDLGISLGTCNGGIQSLSDYYDDIDNGNDGENNLQNYPLYKQMYDVSKYFSIGGPRFSFNSACAASSAAIAYASEMIESGKAKAVIAGGSDPMSAWVYAGFNSLKTFNPKNATPYGMNYGLNLGEAATFFLIKDKAEALNNGDEIICEILGYGFSNDAHHPTAPDVNGNGISLAISEAIRTSGLDNEKIRYINSHGTGTNANDVAELKGIKQVFGDKLPLISSLKGYMGHNLGAAASTELALTLIGLQHNVLYANYEFSDYREETRNKKIFRNHIDLRNSKDRNFAFINNSAAFGGHNSAVIFNFNLDGDYSNKQRKDKKNKKNVYINEIVETTNEKVKSTKETTILGSDKPLKEFAPSLYQRRMNELSQLSIIAGDVAFKNHTSPLRNGLVFGTPLGSMNATTTYIDSIRKNGFGKASGIYFPDLVVNSTSGRVCRALDLKGYAASISSGGNEDLKSVEIAFEALKNDRSDILLVGSGIEGNDITSKIYGHLVKSHVVMAEMTNIYQPENSLLKVLNATSIQMNEEKMINLEQQLISTTEKQHDIKVVIISSKYISLSDDAKKIDYVESDGTGVQGIKYLLDTYNQPWSKCILVEINKNNEAVIVETEKI